MSEQEAFRRLLDNQRIAQQSVGAEKFFRKSKVRRLKDEVASKRGQNRVFETMAADEHIGRTSAVLALNQVVRNLQILKAWASENAPETEQKMCELGLYDVQVFEA